MERQMSGKEALPAVGGPGNRKPARSCVYTCTKRARRGGRGEDVFLQYLKSAPEFQDGEQRRRADPGHESTAARTTSERLDALAQAAADDLS